MRKILVIAILSLMGWISPLHAEHVILSGGPALLGLEGYRVPPERHDRWWANFVRGATLRMELLRKEGSREGITWIVYKKGYIQRGKEDGKNYTKNITDLAKKHNAKLIWVDTPAQIYSAINKFASGGNKISTFDYFGHSNQSAFMIDYSCDILACSTVWIHENDLHKINRNAFRSDAVCVSYGCYTAESMSHNWKNYTGLRLYASTGKTDYAELSFGRMPKPSSGGRWNYSF